MAYGCEREQVENALNDVVNELMAYRGQRQCKDKEFKIFTAAELLQNDGKDIHDWEVCRDPTDYGLKMAIREIGKIIYRRFGNDAMNEISERVATYNGERYYDIRISPICSAWDGIGDWYS